MQLPYVSRASLLHAVLPHKWLLMRALACGMQVKGGADATATANATSQAIAQAIATAYASASSKTTVQGKSHISPA